MANMDFRNSEADTRAELIDPKLVNSGWVRSDKIRVAREYPISIGRIIDSKNRGQKLSADYVLIYKNVIIAVWISFFFPFKAIPNSSIRL